MLIRELKLQVYCQILISSVLIVASLIYWQRSMPDLEIRPIQHWQPSIAEKLLDKKSRGPIAQLSQALARPVFRVTRRPFDPAQLVVVAQPVPPPPPQQQTALTPPAPVLPDTSQMSLKGVAMNASTKRVLIASAEVPDGTWVTLGDVISGWKINAIDKNSVHLAVDGQEVVLSLYVDNLAKPVGSP
jgi:hypothetical protein